MKQLLTHLFLHHTLSRDQARRALLSIAEGRNNEYEVTAFVTVYLMRSVTIEELSGFADALREMWVEVPLNHAAEIDIVGTGGDGKNTFNISTLACFIAAGAGHKVVKHGNAAASSVSGASDVLMRLGYQPRADAEKTNAELEACHFSYLHAPLYHPALAKVAPLRRSLGMRTFFNMLGPLLNPTQPAHAMLGVYNLELARLYEYLLQQSASPFCIVHTLDGYDEISLTADARIVTREGVSTWSPEQLGGRMVRPQDIQGGNTQEAAAQLFQNILAGKGSWAQNAVVLANAAMAMYQTGKYASYELAWKRAAESLEKGLALASFKTLMHMQPAPLKA